MEDRLIKYNKVLKKYFGYDSLKPHQFEIIDTIIHDKRDTCAILATGFGKSMTFILPYLITKKSVIVISPLISLMENQKQKLEELNIPVCVFNNTNKNKVKEKREILGGENKIIYITPEYLLNCEEFVIKLYEMGSLCCFCIDEAHACSIWAEFRPSYTHLGIVKDWLPDLPILTLTATASKKVREDIIKILRLDNPHIVVGSFDRPNLYIQVTSKSKDVERDITELLSKYKNESVIIYCKTRDDTDRITKIVNKMGINCLAYHAGLSNDEREEAQKQFTEGDLKIIVATVAFGMGIDISNIRLIIHYGCPKNLESYYQEIGRAGRDGKQSECHLFYSNKDFIQNKFFLADIKNEKYHKYQEEQIQNIEKFIYTNDCRRILLLKSFDEDFTATNCKNCDNCKFKKNTEKIDLTIACYQLLTLSNVLDGKCGGTLLINILRGSNSKNVTDYIKKNNLYGAGKHESVAWWKAVIRILINNDYLQQVQFGKFGSTLKCSTKGAKWIKNVSILYKSPDKIKDNDRVLLTATDEFKKLNPIKSNSKKILDDSDEEKELLDIMNGNKSLISDEFQNLVKTVKNKIVIKKNPENSNKSWTIQEEEKLLKNIKKKTIAQLAEDHNRTVGGIRSRLNLIAYKLYQKKMPLSNITQLTNITQDKLERIIKTHEPIDNDEQSDSLKISSDKSDKSDKKNNLQKTGNKIIVKGKKN